MNERREIKINVPVLARVEGEGALDLHIRDGRIEHLKFSIGEPPRLFEKFLEGREAFEVPDMVARICGICPVAYQMSAVQALESLFGWRSTPWIEAMRRAMYCGEWIQSHSLHIHLLAAPDFFGYSSAPEMARDYPDEVRRGLRLQSLGNELIRLFGARSVHPVGARLGGFHSAPPKDRVTKLLDRLRAALPDAENLVAWTASVDVPQDQQDFVSVALRHPSEYPLYSGRIVSDTGLDIPVDRYEDRFDEHQEAHSTALYSLLEGRPYLVGPLARLNLNWDRLPEPVSSTLGKTGIPFPSRNVFHSMLARAVEIHLAIVEAIRLLENYEPDVPFVSGHTCVGSGFGCTEAPRGLLWHRYDVGEDGKILKARIVPPTSQNQARIAEDLHRSIEAFGLDRSDDELRLHGEKVIRNYDPCISCATHFLKLKVIRE